jgi:predicted GNAT family acetyltransferase
MKIVDNTALGRFEEIDGGEMATAAYTIAGDTITFTHTAVPESLRGRGVGDVLARAALESARERKLKVNPACPFIAAYLHRHPGLG